VAEPKQEESFKVIDRRLFNEEGTLRQDAVDNERRAEEAEAKKAATAPPPPAPVADAEKTAAVEPAAGTKPASREFQMLIDFLARNAAAMLGGMADPRTGQPFLDLEGASEMIGMLDALRESTRGNLAKADEDLLVEVIGSLKLTYMELSKAAAEQMAKKAKGKV